MNTSPAENWFAQMGWTVFPFQRETWAKYSEGYNGIVNAPTGSGKTYSLMVPILLGMIPPASPESIGPNQRKTCISEASPPLGRGSETNWKSRIIPYNKNLKARAQYLRNHPTEGEKLVWKHLKGKNLEGYDFDRQKPIDRFIVDFYCRELNLVIEINGERHLNARQLKYDKARDQRLFELGLNVLRFDGELVFNRMDEVIGWIQQYVEAYIKNDWRAFEGSRHTYLNGLVAEKFCVNENNPPPDPLPGGGGTHGSGSALPALLRSNSSGSEEGEGDHAHHASRAGGRGANREDLRATLKNIQPEPGLQAIWITPIRALSKEILQAAQRAAAGMGIDARIAIRTGDTETSEKTRLRKSPPHVLITTPETLHVLMTQKNYAHYFKHLRTVVIDEWHELIGSKRGVQCELALSRLKGICPGLRIWGISATIGNMDESLQVLLGNWYNERNHVIVKGRIKKKYVVKSVFPDELEELPWAGHLGIRLIQKILPIIRSSGSTLIFLNTRGQAEIWYQKLLEQAPELAGIIALHHGSMSREVRHWVEDALGSGQLKAVICTSSLDLGVDFRPVETIIQVGGPKGVARFMQRAGRSGHQPGATSKIYFVPTHSLELIEAAALREAIKEEMVESRVPYVRSFDVLIQYLVTLAVSDGFREEEIFAEVKGTFCYDSMSEEEWHWCLNFITRGGDSLANYDEFHKVVVEDGIYKVTSKGVALRHRLSIGTIVSDNMLKVKFVSGAYLGNIEEYFVARLNPGDVFWFAGRSLEFVRIKEMTVQVRKSTKQTGPIPSWQGGRMPLSSQMSKMLRHKLNEAVTGQSKEPEIRFLAPLIARQQNTSAVPREDEFLIECFESRDGYHVIMYPFEGRFVHEGMGALMAYRISLLQPITFSIAMNDYGFELLSDRPIPIEDAIDTNIFSTAHLMDDILQSVNSVEMARRRFRDIASIAGLVFQGYPGSQKKERHLQASAQLFFNVFNDYDPKNLLLRQAFDEVMDFQLEEVRLREALTRINSQGIVVKKPGAFTPFAFPIIVDRLREKLTSESLQERIQRMKVRFEK